MLWFNDYYAYTFYYYYIYSQQVIFRAPPHEKMEAVVRRIGSSPDTPIRNLTYAHHGKMKEAVPHLYDGRVAHLYFVLAVPRNAPLVVPVDGWQARGAVSLSPLSIFLIEVGRVPLVVSFVVPLVVPVDVWQARVDVWQARSLIEVGRIILVLAVTLNVVLVVPKDVFRAARQSIGSLSPHTVAYLQCKCPRGN